MQQTGMQQTADASVDAGASVPAGDLDRQPRTLTHVRVNQHLSSNRNKPGDASRGAPAAAGRQRIRVAQRGSAYGSLTHGREAGASKERPLGTELVPMTMVRASKRFIRTGNDREHGNTSFGREAEGQSATTVLGATYVVRVNGGWARVWGGAGGGCGVTRGPVTRHDTVIYPEQSLSPSHQAVTIRSSVVPRPSSRSLADYPNVIAASTRPRRV